MGIFEEVQIFELPSGLPLLGCGRFLGNQFPLSDQFADPRLSKLDG